MKLRKQKTQRDIDFETYKKEMIGGFRKIDDLFHEQEKSDKKADILSPETFIRVKGAIESFLNEGCGRKCSLKNCHVSPECHRRLIEKIEKAFGK